MSVLGSRTVGLPVSQIGEEIGEVVPIILQEVSKVMPQKTEFWASVEPIVEIPISWSGEEIEEVVQFIIW